MAERDAGALRLIFERRGDDVRLVDSVEVDMVVPPSDDLDVDDTRHSGFAVRVYSEGGKLLYRRAMADPLARDAEVYTGDPDHPFERHLVDIDSVQFEIVVPNTGNDVEVELLASPPRDGPKAGRARPLKRVPVRGKKKKKKDDKDKDKGRDK